MAGTPLADLGQLLNVILGSRLGQAGLTYLGATDQRRAEDEARQATLGRYNQALRMLQELRNRSMQTSTQHGAQEQGTLQQIRDALLARGGAMASSIPSSIAQQYRNLESGYRRQEQDLLNRVGTLGKQERADIERAALENQRSSIQNLRERGLGASSLVAGAYGRAQRERADELGRLNDRLNQMRLNVSAGLGGQRLAAQERGYGAQSGASERLQSGLLGLDTQLQNAIFQNMAGRNANVEGLDQQGIANIVNLMASRNDIPPSINPLLAMAQILGQRQPDAPDQPSTSSQVLSSAAGPAAGAAAGAGTTALLSGLLGGGGAGIGLAAKVFVLCVDGNALIWTPDGLRPLKEIAVGDPIYDWYQNVTEVIDKDYGLPADERHGDFVEIETPALRLTITKDHPIYDKPSGQYQAGDQVKTVIGTMTVGSVHSIPAVPCGDLKLANGNGYIANGFMVNSMFTETGV